MSHRSATGASGVRRPASHATRGATHKPFSSYRSAPPVSAYQNLFRNDNADGTINNYYTLVKPFVEQRYKNQRFNSALHGLQRSSRTQNSAIRRLGETTDTLQGVATPQYYQNFGRYFPRSGGF